MFVGHGSVSIWKGISAWIAVDKAVLFLVKESASGKLRIAAKHNATPISAVASVNTPFFFDESDVQKKKKVFKRFDKLFTWAISNVDAEFCRRGYVDIIEANGIICEDEATDALEDLQQLPCPFFSMLAHHTVRLDSFQIRFQAVKGVLRIV